MELIHFEQAINRFESYILKHNINLWFSFLLSNRLVNYHIFP